MRNFKVFSGSAHPQLAAEICANMDYPLGQVSRSRFSDGEIGIQISESVRGQDIFIIQPACPPANDNLMEILLMIDALKRSSASSIIAVMPYFGYARQDRKAALAVIQIVRLRFRR
jgi:ribose-phosphate pyrophosphokinase